MSSQSVPPPELTWVSGLGIKSLLFHIYSRRPYRSTSRIVYQPDFSCGREKRSITSKFWYIWGLINFCFKEISFDVFLQVVWLDPRLKPTSAHLGPKHYIEITMEKRKNIWLPDLYIRQLREMKILKVFEEISSLRIYENSTVVRSIAAEIIIKCDMDFSLFPLDVQLCPVDFSSCRILMVFGEVQGVSLCMIRNHII